MLTPKPREVAWMYGAAFAAGALVLAILAGQVYAWIERRRIDWIGGAA